MHSQSRRKEAMSHRKQHTSRESSVQVSDPATADWQQLVEERLPSSLESQAQALGAFVRVRRIKSASLLLRAQPLVVERPEHVEPTGGGERRGHLGASLAQAIAAVIGLAAVALWGTAG